MAKDGTMRGGLRVGSGQKKKALRAKLLEGQPINELTLSELPEPAELEGAEVPDVAEWLKEPQYSGEEKHIEEWQAEELAKRVFLWVKRMGCEEIITEQQIYSYAVAQARWIQCQRAISRYGFLAKTKKQGAEVIVESPFVEMADKFAKTAAAAWWSIYQIAKANSTAGATGDVAERTMAGLID